MSELPWKHWHQVVEPRPDVRTGELSLSQLAADIYEVIMDRGAAVSDERDRNQRTPA